MSIHEKDNALSEIADSDEERLSDKGESNRFQSNSRTFTSSSNNLNYVSYRNRTDSGQNRGLERTVNSFDASKTTTNATSLYQASVVGASSTSDIVYTRSATETERYLDNHGISLCKSPDVVRRTVVGKPVEYEQRVCLRYLQPPPLPLPGPLTIEEIQKPGLPGPPLVIREQPIIVDAPAPLILRERPPTPPPIPRAETKTVIIPSNAIQERSVIVERYPAIQEKPRDIIIERWLPYGPLREREVIVRKIGCQEESKATCTIINYDNPQPRVNRKFVVVDVYNADPEDYMARYRESLLNSSELVQQVRRVGVNEDISSPLSVSIVEVTPVGLELKYSENSSYNDVSNLAEASNTTKYERRAD